MCACAYAVNNLYNVYLWLWHYGDFNFQLVSVVFFFQFY